MADKDKLIKIAKELNELYKSKKAALPYSLNVIRELHANENANSRILRGLLQYSHNGQYPILLRFIERLRTIADCPIDISVQNPELTNEQDNRIDLLIKEKKSYAIVVENKIWGARDMRGQIERYIEYVNGIGIKGRSLQEQMMNLDLKAAYEHSMLLAHQHTDFTIEMLKGLSAIVMKNTGASYNTAQGSFDASKGDLRLVGVTAGIGGRSYMNYQKVPAKLAELCQLINQRRKTLLQSTDVIEQYLLSFDAHYQLVTIHPWVDGNGRMSRLVMNHLQYEFGLVPVKIVKEDKAEYIQALVDSREQESLEPFHEFMMEEHARNIAKEIEAFKKSQNDDPIKVASDPIKMFDDPIKLQLFQAIVQDGALNYAEYAAQIGVSEATVKRRLGELKNDGVIIRVGSKKTGRWEILDSSGR